MSDSDPIAFPPRGRAGQPAMTGAAGALAHGGRRETGPVVFDRRELSDILALYGRKVAAGEWRDYTLDFGRESAVFSVFRRSSEWPLYRIEKSPRNARKQGAYSVITATGLILKRGNDLKRVIDVLEKRSLYVVENS